MLLAGDLDIKTTWESLKSWIRKRYIFRWVLGNENDNQTAVNEEWSHFFSFSESLGLTMTKIYAMFRPTYMVVGPIFIQLVKLSVTLGCVLLEVNSSQQLAVAGAIEVLNCFFIVVCRPFAATGIQRVSTFGAMHEVGIITLSAYYRVALFDEDSDAQKAFGFLMFIFTFGFLLMVTYVLYTLGIHEVLREQVMAIIEMLRPAVKYTFFPMGEMKGFYVGERSTKAFAGYKVNHGERVQCKITSVYGTVVGTDGQKGHLFWLPDGLDGRAGKAVLAAVDGKSFGDTFTCFGYCESFEGKYTSV